MSIIEDQEQFMLRGGQTVATYNEKQYNLYGNLIDEETTEFKDAFYGDDPLENQVKECIDVIVVCIGFLFSLGISPLKAWSLVWHNNIAKVCDEVKYDKNGKIMKSKESKQRKDKMMEDIRGLLK